jgi:CHAT domain-containing protein
LGGTQETLSGFGAQYANFYREYIDLLVGQNQPAAAFHVLERSRARTLLAMLAERDLVFTADIPDDIDRERKRIAWEYDQAQATLGALSPLRDQTRIEALVAQIRTFRDRQNEIVTRIRQQSPRLASLQYPQPLDVGAVQAALDPGTVLLSYSIGTNRSFLFALTADARVQVFSLAVGETQLREDVRRFHSLIQRAAIGERDVTEVVERGRQLFNLLLQPASAAIAQAQRLLIVPDGPLHALPFAALVRAGAANTARERRDWH